jgi:hypothetical protein
MCIVVCLFVCLFGMGTVSLVNYFVCPWEEICVQCKLK